MIYYTADPHFGHPNIITLCNRPFDDVEDMNESLTAYWNGRVRSEDTVYVLGDMFYKCEPDEAESILKKLKGHKHLIVGNHDDKWMSGVDAGKYFESVGDMAEVNDGGRVCVLCHYPLLTWKREKRTLMIYGHIHNDTGTDFWPLIARRENMLNAGVEVNNYVPVTLPELISNNRSFTEAHGSDKNVLEYNGFTGSVEVSMADRCLYGKLLDVDGLYPYDGETLNDLEKDFRYMVDFYIEDEKQNAAAGKKAEGDSLNGTGVSAD